MLDSESVAPTADGFVVNFPAGLANIAVSEDGSRLALAHNLPDPSQPGGLTRLVVFDATTGAARWSDTYPSHQCCSAPRLLITPDGEYTLGVGNGVRVYDHNGRVSFVAELSGKREFVTSVSLSDDGQWVAMTANNGRTYVYSVNTDRLTWSNEFSSGASVALSGDGKWLLVVEATVARLYTLPDMRQTETWRLDFQSASTLAGLSREASLAVAAGYDTNKDILVDVYDRSLNEHHTVRLGHLILPEMKVASNGEWVQVVARFKGGAALIARDGSIMETLLPAATPNGPTLARDGEWQALSEGNTIRVGDRVLSLDGAPQAVWLAGRRMAALGAPDVNALLSDRLWVWSVTSP